MIRKSPITQADKERSNFAPNFGESKTDKSQFRPDIASIRDKAIAMNESGAGNIGLYDIKSEEDKKNTPQELLNAVSYARNAKRDIAEVESAKKAIEASIERGKAIDKENVEREIEKRTTKKTLEKIEENTRNKAAETTNTNM